MGQGSSVPTSTPSEEELALRLTNVFAEKCFTSSELNVFKQTFKAFAKEDESGVKYWSEGTLVKFLELPDAIGSGAVYHLCCYFAAFPFSSGNGQPVLTGEALLRVACFMTGRFRRLLHTGEGNWVREIWRGCAVLDGESEFDSAAKKTDPTQEPSAETTPENESEEGSKEPRPNDKIREDELAFHILQLIDALEDFKQPRKIDVQDAIIPNNDFLNLVQLLLLIAPLGPQETIPFYTAHLEQERLEGLRIVANCIMASFGVEQKQGIGQEAFELVVSNALPHLFDSFAPLFEHFLCSGDLDKKKRKDSGSDHSAPSSTLQDLSLDSTIAVPEPLLSVQGDILDLNSLSQLSFIFSAKSIYGRLRPLYRGHIQGYSMGSFEKAAFTWQGPSILLVSGTLISQGTKKSRARTFLDDLPHRRLSSSVGTSAMQSLAEAHTTEAPTKEDAQHIIYGAYVPVPWQATEKTAFGTDKTTLFQLSPFHDVFTASSSGQNYAYFNKPPSTYPGLGFGSPLPTYNSMGTSQSSLRRSSVTSYSASDTGWGSGSFSNSFSGPSSPGLARRSSLIGDEHLPLGPVSLHIDDGLEFGVFTHLASGGGSFQSSKLPASARSGNGVDWQDRFEINAIDVWGVESGIAT